MLCEVVLLKPRYFTDETQSLNWSRFSNYLVDSCCRYNLSVTLPELGGVIR